MKVRTTWGLEIDRHHSTNDIGELEAAVRLGASVSPTLSVTDQLSPVFRQLPPRTNDATSHAGFDIPDVRCSHRLVEGVGAPTPLPAYSPRWKGLRVSIRGRTRSRNPAVCISVKKNGCSISNLLRHA